VQDQRGARFENLDLSGAVFKEVMLVNARISGLIDGLTVNDVEVAPLIRAELDRRYPERTKLRPATADEVREAWALVEQMWADTIARVRELPEPMLHEAVDGEWSFLETLRHLVFVIDAWISGRVLAQPSPFHPLGVAPSFIRDPSAMGIDVDADPRLDEVLEVVESRDAIVRGVIAPLTDIDLERQCGEHTLQRCLWTLFDEKWHHHWFATRDLEVLTGNG
jgi:hypothetical protein